MKVDQFALNANCKSSFTIAKKFRKEKKYEKA